MSKREQLQQKIEQLGRDVSYWKDVADTRRHQTPLEVASAERILKAKIARELNRLAGPKPVCLNRRLFDLLQVDTDPQWRGPVVPAQWSLLGHDIKFVESGYETDFPDSD